MAAHELLHMLHVCYSVQSVRSKEEKEVLDHFAGVVTYFVACY